MQFFIGKHKATVTRHVQFFTRNGIKFQEIIVLPAHTKISVCSMSSTANATTSEILQEN